MGDPYYEYDIIDEAGIPYTHLAQISNPTYVEKATSYVCVRDNNYNEFKANLKNNPGRYI